MSLTPRPRTLFRVALIPLLCGVALLAACGASSQHILTPPASHQSAPFKVPNYPAPGATTKSTNPITLVVLGASDAFGVGTDDPDRLNWPDDLATELGSDNVVAGVGSNNPATELGPLSNNVHLVNLGIPGATLAQAMHNELPIALSVHPDIVTIWLAVNDFASGLDATTYGEQLTSLLASLRQDTRARVYVANLPDLSLVPYFSAQDPATLRAQVQEWNSVIAAASARAGAHLVDLAVGWQDLADHPEYISGDGLHPSTIGAQRLADAFAAVIRQSDGA